MARSPVSPPESDMTPNDETAAGGKGAANARHQQPLGERLVAAVDAGSLVGRPRPEPLDPPMVPFAVAGLIGWAAAGLVLLIFFRDWLADQGHTDWLWICLAGFLLGIPGLAIMIRHDANRLRRSATRAAEGPPQPPASQS